ncbi:hypothetical protein GCM10009554_43760 [Kribbella koreensis]|uniref:DKNYY family protein n=1 Tax=Kribbella koreensis TaxID=57909 RepID=A0ABN1QT66_9ACTN
MKPRHPSARRTATLTAALTAAMLLPGPPATASVPSTGLSAGRNCPLPTFGPGATYRPRISPGQFSPHVTNRYFPLKVGRTLIYTGVKDGKKALNLTTTTSRTKLVDGVRTRVVEDRLYLDNVLEERTSDYYAQDRCGNVWYFGEDTATLDARGRVVSTEGSFHAGIDGAQPGVFMQAHPQLSRWFRQEWYAGQAEDTFRVIDRSARIRVPYGSFRHALLTEEKTALEPGVLDNKYYVPGIGEIFEGSVKGPREALRLVEIIS